MIYVLVGYNLFVTDSNVLIFCSLCCFISVNKIYYLLLILGLLLLLLNCVMMTFLFHQVFFIMTLLGALVLLHLRRRNLDFLDR